MKITRDQLRLQIDRLEDVFGERGFSEQREMSIWEVVDGLEYAFVISVVDGFIKSSRKTPLPIDFLEACQGVKNDKKCLGEQQENPYCHDCRDSGFVQLERRAEFEPWAKAETCSAPCHCSRGAELIRAGKRMKSPTDLGPQYSSHWETSYKIIHLPQDLFTNKGVQNEASINAITRHPDAIKSPDL